MIGIIALLVGIAVPVIIKAKRSAFKTRLAADQQAIAAGLDQYKSDLGDIPRLDLANAAETVGSQNAGMGTEDVLGFVPDTVILPATLVPTLMNNTDFLQVYNAGANADEDIRYTGRLPGTVMGLTVLTSRFWVSNKALVLQRGEVGFRSDSRPLEVTPLYGEGGGPNGGPTESWRPDTTRKRVRGLDQPKAACWINGIV